MNCLACEKTIDDGAKVIAIFEGTWEDAPLQRTTDFSGVIFHDECAPEGTKVGT